MHRLNRLRLAAVLALAAWPAAAQPSREGIAERIAQAAQMANAWRRCGLPSDQPFPNFEEVWAKEIARTRAALKDKLALPDADVDALMAPVLEKVEPFPDSTPASEARAYCNAAGDWTVRFDKMLVSSDIESGNWSKPKPLTGLPGADDAAVLAAMKNTLSVWRMAASCDVLSQTVMESTFRNWPWIREDAMAELKRFDLSRTARMQVGLMLDFSYQLEPAMGTLGELRRYCADNAALIAKARDLKAKLFVYPGEALKAVEPAPKVSP